MIDELKKIGIQEGMEIEVHSALSSFGYVEGGAKTVIDALMECVGKNGSIFMPALSLGPAMELTEEDRKMGITVKIKVLPPNAPKTDMGIIADTFRQRQDVITGEGIIRTSGWGLHAKQAAVGGLDYVIHNGGKALMLGVDIYKLTAMHYVEAGEPSVKAWYTIQNMAYQKGLIKDGYIGKCKYMFFDIWDVVSIYKKELEMNALKLYGLE